MATTYARQEHPDVERAADLGTLAVTTLAGQVQSPRVVGHVTRLVDHLADFRDVAAVRHFTERARVLSVGRNVAAGPAAP